MSNSIFYIVKLVIGTILIPGTTQLTARDIKERLQTSGTVCIITDDETAPLVDEVMTRMHPPFLSFSYF